MGKQLDFAETLAAVAQEQGSSVAALEQEHECDFEWSDSESVVIPSQPAVACYFNPRGEVVIRQEGQYDEDHCVYIQIKNLPPLIGRLQSIARGDIEPA